jgi:nucleotide-binding universal stress UspA family protein
MHTPPRSILVGLGPRRDSRTLAVAAALAQRENARLTVLAAAIRPSLLSWASPLPLPYDPLVAAEDECDKRLRTAVAALPAELSVTALLRHRPAPAALLAELRSGAHDLVVVGGRRQRRIGMPWSTARRLLRRARVPVLVVDAEPVAIPESPRDLVAQGA